MPKESNTKHLAASVPKAAEAVGATAAMLYKWKEKVEAQARGEALSEDERAELKLLAKLIGGGRQKYALCLINLHSVGLRYCAMPSPTIIAPGGRSCPPTTP